MKRASHLVADHLLSQPGGHHLLQGLLFTLGLPGQLGRAVTEPGDVVLHNTRSTGQLQAGSRAILKYFKD